MLKSEVKLVIAAANREGFEGPIQGWRIVGNRVEMWDLHGRHLETELVPEDKVIVDASLQRLEMEPSQFDFITPEPKKRKPAQKKGK